MIYLLSGTDEISKQEKVQALKNKLFAEHNDCFDCEIVYAKDLSLSAFKESALRLPASFKNRLLIINNADKLKEEIKEYFLVNCKSFPEYLNIVLNAGQIAKNDAFFSKVSVFAKVFISKSVIRKDAFSLAEFIEQKQADSALRILADLFKEGERPEKIMGALRYKFTRTAIKHSERLRKINLLLETDIRIKTGKLKPEFALEALVVRLCS